MHVDIIVMKHKCFIFLPFIYNKNNFPTQKLQTEFLSGKIWYLFLFILPCPSFSLLSHYAIFSHLLSYRYNIYYLSLSCSIFLRPSLSLSLILICVSPSLFLSNLILSPSLFLICLFKLYFTTESTKRYRRGNEGKGRGEEGGRPGGGGEGGIVEIVSRMRIQNR